VCNSLEPCEASDKRYGTSTLKIPGPMQFVC
jgi:hypothetical protein